MTQKDYEDSLKIFINNNNTRPFFPNVEELTRKIECEKINSQILITARTALHRAARNGHEAVVKLLLKKAVKTDSKD